MNTKKSEAMTREGMRAREQQLIRDKKNMCLAKTSYGRTDWLYICHSTNQAILNNKQISYSIFIAEAQGRIHICNMLLFNILLYYS